MSHFCVLVIGNDVEEQLAKYQENNMGDCPEEYLEFIDTTDEVLTKAYEVIPDEEYYQKHHPKGIEKTYLEYFGDGNLDTFAYDYYGFSRYGNKYGYKSNPNAKWDSWKIGGSWKGYLLKKDGSLTSQACKSDIDFNKMYANKLDAADADWEKFLAYKEDPNFRPLTAYLEFGVKNIGGVDNLDNFIPESYLSYKTRLTSIATFAVIKDGIWYEKGEMGWWCQVNNEKSTEDWDSEFWSLINSLSDDTLLTIVDCHF
jgi:hypothetical protein